MLALPVSLSHDTSPSNRPVKYVWHGSNKYGETSHNYNCNAWSSSSARVFGMASSLASLKLLGQNKVSCDNKLIILCIETSSTLPKRRKRETFESGTIEQKQQDVGRHEYDKIEENVNGVPLGNDGMDSDVMDQPDVSFFRVGVGNPASPSSSAKSDYLAQSVMTSEAENYIENYRHGEEQSLLKHRQAKTPVLTDMYEI